MAAAVFLLPVLNGFLAFPIAVSKDEDPAFVSGFVIGQALFFPLLVVGLFQFSRGFRNLHSMIRVFFWTSVIVASIVLENRAMAWFEKS